MPTNVDSVRAQRIELILQQVQTLPTLSPVAIRLLRLSSDEDADLRQIVTLVESDVALTSRLLSMCRRADKGLGETVITVERAVTMLGFDAVRSALLSVHLYDMLSPADEREIDGDVLGDETVDRAGLWRHAIGVACAADLIVERAGAEISELRRDEAFICGLLHDLGKYALDVILPRAYARTAAIAQGRRANIAEVERAVIGVDHHTAGKRLAEHWGLPHAIQDVIWLHNQPASMLPDVPHRRLISVVSAADSLARRLRIGWSGNQTTPDPEGAFRDCGLSPDLADVIGPELLDRVARRIVELGLEEETPPDDALRSVLAANAKLGAINRSVEERGRSLDLQERLLAAIAMFHRNTSPSHSLLAAFSDVARSACGLFGAGFYAMVYQARAGRPWHVCQCSGDGRVLRSQSIEPPPGCADLAELADTTQLSSAGLALLPWIQDFTLDSEDVRGVRILPLSTGAGRPTLLLHDRTIEPTLLRSPSLQAVTATWAASIAAAAQHEGARRLGEQLAEANRILTETQSRLTEASSLARLGEMAAGAAHEMNNPLTIISGRSQVLLAGAADEPTRRAARAVAEASGKLSDLISSLHFFADPPRPQRRMTDLPDLLARVVRDVNLDRAPADGAPSPVRLQIRGPLPPAWVDADQVAEVMSELLQNAIEARPRGFIAVRVQIDSADGRLVIEVKDDGCGMSPHALDHAFDPFFSEKPAGRQSGLGLARANRLVELHGGRIELESERGRGTTARVVLDQWRQEAPEEHIGHAA